MKFLAHNSQTKESVIVISDHEMKSLNRLLYIIEKGVMYPDFDYNDPWTWTYPSEGTDLSVVLNAIINFLRVSNMVKNASEKLSELTAMFKHDQDSPL